MTFCVGNAHGLRICTGNLHESCDQQTSFASPSSNICKVYTLWCAEYDEEYKTTLKTITRSLIMYILLICPTFGKSCSICVMTPAPVLYK